MKKTSIILLLAVPAASYAFFCPSNFNQIDFGMTIDQVTAQCGKPDGTKKYTTQEDKMPQEWTYYIPQTVSANTYQQATGTMKISFAFDANGKAINISVNGIGVGATTICGRNVQLGDMRDTIKTSCGDPSFINKQNAPGTSIVGQGTQNNIDVTEYIYKSNPPATLVFENGVLKSKK